jgi:hypothetical protein
VVPESRCWFTQSHPKGYLEMRTHSKDNSLQTRVADKMVHNVNLPNFIARKQQDKRNRMDERKKTRAKVEKA